MKTNQIILLTASAIILVLVFYAGCRCERSRNPIATSRIDTIVNTDTVEVTIEKEKLVPHAVNKYIKGNSYPVIQFEHDTLFSPIVIGDTNQYVLNILDRYFDTAYYRTIHQLRNGTVMAFDTVTQNRLMGKGFKAIIFDTLIKETVVYPPQPQRAVLYLGASAFGNKYNLIKGLGADLSLKTPNGMLYSAGVKYLSDTILIKRGNLYYEAQAKVPLINLYKRRNK